jgi:hypothetical protein
MYRLVTVEYTARSVLSIPYVTKFGMASRKRKETGEI